MNGLDGNVGLELFHGRTDPTAAMDNWGSQGPVFLVRYVHNTYHADLKLGIPEPAGDGDLKIEDGLVYYDGIYYGDWSVFPASLIEREPALKSRLRVFDKTKATPPKQEQS